MDEFCKKCGCALRVIDSKNVLEMGEEVRLFTVLMLTCPNPNCDSGEVTELRLPQPLETV